MGKALEDYLDTVRKLARDKAAAVAKTRIQGQRDAERTLRAQGIKVPFDDWNLADFERISKVEFEALSANELFAARYEALRSEVDGEIQVVREAEDSAVAKAMESLPPDVAIRDGHEKTRELFVGQAGYAGEEDLRSRAPEAVKLQFAEMTKRQEREIHATTK